MGGGPAAPQRGTAILAVMGHGRDARATSTLAGPFVGPPPGWRRLRLLEVYVPGMEEALCTEGILSRILRRGIIPSGDRRPQKAEVCASLRVHCMRHGLDPLTRPAPADEDAGGGPPSPPRGRGV